LLGLLADIRAAVGDPKGKLMQDELVERCRKLYADTKRLADQRVVRDLAETWERRLAEKRGATRDALDCGRTLQLRECCDELRAELGKIQNAKAMASADEKTSQKETTL
jgi:hypothetical protein